ncbi:MAG: hypothetical protein AAF990_08415 [Bacteroidota bacterium]
MKHEAQSPTMPRSEEDDITLKDVILKVFYYLEEVLRNWKWLLLFPIPFALFMMYRTWHIKPLYPGTLSFMVNENDGGGVSGVSAVLGQIGIGRGRGKYSLDKILELSKSQRIIQKALFTKVEIFGKNDFLANHVIDYQNLNEVWIEDESPLVDFKFKNDRMEERYDRMAFKVLYVRIIGGEERVGLFRNLFSEESGIMYLIAETNSEGLTIELLKAVYHHLSEFYVKKTTEKQAQTLEIVSNKVDSLMTMLESTEYSLAQFRDANRGLVTRQSMLRESRLERDVTIIGAMLAEAVRNREIAEFSLKTKTPFIQLIDAPIAPIKPRTASVLISTIIGAILGVILGVVFIVVRRIYWDIMES